MKKIVSLILLLAVFLSLGGCVVTPQKPSTSSSSSSASSSSSGSSLSSSSTSNWEEVYSPEQQPAEEFWIIPSA